MTKHELADLLAKQSNMTQQDAYDYIEQVFDLIINNVQHGEVVKIRGFGTFRLTTHKTKRLVHPITKQKSILPQRNVITFTLGRALRNKLNEK